MLAVTALCVLTFGKMSVAAVGDVLGVRRGKRERQRLFLLVPCFVHAVPKVCPDDSVVLGWPGSGRVYVFMLREQPSILIKCYLDSAVCLDDYQVTKFHGKLIYVVHTHHQSSGFGLIRLLFFQSVPTICRAIG